MNNLYKLSLITLALSLTACGSSSSDKKEEKPVVEPPPVVVTDTVYGPLSTGTSQVPEYAYFDLDEGKVVELTQETAKTDTIWDIAFRRGSIFLNQNENNLVSVNFTGNNADFLDTDGKAVVEKFVNATPESELEDYVAVTHASIPTDEESFKIDKTEKILDGFHNYDSTTHLVSAASDNFFIIQTGSAFAKFSVVDLTQVFYAMSSVTFNVAMQAEGAEEFGDSKTVALDLAMLCSDTETSAVYVDFETGMEVSADAAYHVSIPCSDANGTFELNLHADAKAIKDFDNAYQGVDAATAHYYGFQSNEYSTKAFDDNKWYVYNLEQGHKLWSQYGVYIVKTPTADYKFQITSYYDDEGNSGSYTFRADKLTAE
ncbi:hypothetical protein CJF42_16025 [Pseudoalteromonas sp. NBT06-2]|uniref:HmuY family protein n=1 Tax=Pseudoalteromonas sp. NBT06-2 TaxID=2025950 RepID=UPI000BA716C6|nr:HmuY family protein [Pseudoalteromonas sp. NBT06-2]PAJ73420.1 hypothetical protein CJF42_16025 [Pseudoalteromonas sp. NBT06-2]